MSSKTHFLSALALSTSLLCSPAFAQSTPTTPPASTSAPDQAKSMNDHKDHDIYKRGGNVFGTRAFMSHRFMRMKPEERAVFVDAHLAAMKAGLKLTADQDKLWAPLETTIRDGIAKREAFHAQMKGKPATSPIDRLTEFAEMSTLNGEILKKVADAARPLYNSLSDEQKKRLDMLSGKSKRDRHNGGSEKQD